MPEDWKGCSCRQSLFASILLFSCSVFYFFALSPFAYVPGSLLNRIPLRPLVMGNWLTYLSSFLTHLQMDPFNPGQLLYFIHQFGFRFLLVFHQFLMFLIVKFISVQFSRFQLTALDRFTRFDFDWLFQLILVLEEVFYRSLFIDILFSFCYIVIHDAAFLVCEEYRIIYCPHHHFLYYFFYLDFEYLIPDF